MSANIAGAFLSSGLLRFNFHIKCETGTDRAFIPKRVREIESTCIYWYSFEKNILNGIKVYFLSESYWLD